MLRATIGDVKAAATGLALLTTVAAAARVRADENPTMKEAGAKRCSAGRPILLQKLPPDERFSLDTRFAMTASGGLAIMRAAGGWVAQPLAANGSKRGEARPFEWPALYGQSVTAAGGRLLVLGEHCSRDKLNCISARWIEHDGASGERREIDVGDRHLDQFPRAVGDRVRVLATRRKDNPGTDLWLDIGRDETGHVDVLMREIDILGQHPAARFQNEPDGPWLIAVWITGRIGEQVAQARYVNADGKGGPIAGWPTAGQLIMTAPGRRVLVWPDTEHHTEWIDYRLELDGTLTEQHRAPTARALPPPYVKRVSAYTTGRNGVSLSRSSLGDDLPPTLITGHLRPIPGDVVWAAGRFFVVYAERNKDAVLVKLRTASCK